MEKVSYRILGYVYLHLANIMVACSRRDSMFSFLLCVVVLIASYIFYETFVEKIFGPDDRKTPAISVNDGVDYVPMKTWKVSLIQLLNLHSFSNSVPLHLHEEDNNEENIGIRLIQL